MFWGEGGGGWSQGSGASVGVCRDCGKVLFDSKTDKVERLAIRDQQHRLKPRGMNLDQNGRCGAFLLCRIVASLMRIFRVLAFEIGQLALAFWNFLKCGLLHSMVPGEMLVVMRCTSFWPSFLTSSFRGGSFPLSSLLWGGICLAFGSIRKHSVSSLKVEDITAESNPRSWGNLPLSPAKARIPFL